MPQFSFARDTGTTGFNLQFYSPAIDPNGMWTVNSTKMLAPGQFYILTENNVSGGQFSVINLGVLVKIFDQAATTDVLVSMGVTDFVTLGVDMPITPWLKSADFNVDDEVENLIREAAARARIVLKANLPKLEVLKVALLEKETVEAVEVLKILDGSIMPKEAALY